MPFKFSKNEIKIWKPLVVLQTNTSIFYTIPHISWTAYDDAFLTVTIFVNEDTIVTTWVFKMNY